MSMEPEVIFDKPQAAFPQPRDAPSDEHLKILMMARFGSKTVLAALKNNGRSTPINGHHRTGSLGPFRAKTGNRLRQ